VNENEIIYSFNCATHFFVGKKATAVYFDNERVAVKTWKQVYSVILDRCNRKCHDNLMYLRNKTAGRVRVFLSDTPDSMTRPLKIDTGLWGETHYGSATLLHILRERILSPARFPYSNIRIAVKA